MSLAIFLYAPLRAWSLHGIRKFSGRVRPSLADSLHRLLERAQATENPTTALEQTLQWMLNPDDISWIFPNQKYGALLDRLAAASDGVLGYQLGEACPKHMESSALIPIQIDQEPAALVLAPRGARGWNRHDLLIARTLSLSSPGFTWHCLLFDTVRLILTG